MCVTPSSTPTNTTSFPNCNTTDKMVLTKIRCNHCFVNKSNDIDNQGQSSSSSWTAVKGNRCSRRTLLCWVLPCLAIIDLSIIRWAFLDLSQQNEFDDMMAPTIPIQRTEPGLHVIMAHCSVPLDWIYEEYTTVDHGVNSTLKSVTIINKCGIPPFLDPNITFPNVNQVDILQLPNVGGCDHSYAYWIEKMLYDHQNNEPMRGLYHLKDLILFSKDTTQKYKSRRSLESMKNGAQRRGFYCGFAPPVKSGRNFADKQYLGTFQIGDYKRSASNASSTTLTPPFQSPHRPLSAWVETLPVNISYTTPGIVDFCLCGVFMTTLHQIVHAPVANWSAIVEALSRGDNIEEGHYMERLWGGLLAPPVSLEKEEQLRGRSSISRPGFYGGILMNSKSEVFEDDP